MDSNAPERRLVLHCAEQLLALEMALQRGRKVTPRLRQRLLLVHDLVDSLEDRLPLHPAMEGLTATELIGYRIDQVRKLVAAMPGTAETGSVLDLLETT